MRFGPRFFYGRYFDLWAFAISAKVLSPYVSFGRGFPPGGAAFFVPPVPAPPKENLWK